MKRLVQHLWARPYINLTIIAALAAFTSYKFMPPQIVDALDFKYLSIECSIFDVTGKVVYVRNQIGCAFARDGSLLTMDPKLFDKTDRETAAAAELFSHHMVKFSHDQKAVLIIEAENITFEGKKVKSDCFVKRDLKFNLISRWCLKDHLEELKSLGFSFKAMPTDNWDPRYASLASIEISHANSISEIASNKYSSQNAAFAPGNYLINVYGESGALIIVDDKMEKILWHKNMNNFRWPATENPSEYRIVGEPKENSFVLRLINHDDQVRPDGSIVTYATIFLVPVPGLLESRLSFLYKIFNKKESDGPNLRKRTYAIRWDPFDNSERVEILFKAPQTKSTKVPSGGQVTILENNNVMVTESTEDGSEVIVADRFGKVLWRFPYPIGEGGTKPHFLHAKPIYDEGFITSRGLN